MAPAFVLSSRTRWPRPIAVPPNSPPNSAALKILIYIFRGRFDPVERWREAPKHGSDQIHRRYAAVAAAAGLRVAAAVSVGAPRFSRSVVRCHRPGPDLAHHAP